MLMMLLKPPCLYLCLSVYLSSYTHDGNDTVAADDHHYDDDGHRCAERHAHKPSLCIYTSIYRKCMLHEFDGALVWLEAPARIDGWTDGWDGSTHRSRLAQETLCSWAWARIACWIAFAMPTAWQRAIVDVVVVVVVVRRRSLPCYNLTSTLARANIARAVWDSSWPAIDAFDGCGDDGRAACTHEKCLYAVCVCVYGGDDDGIVLCEWWHDGLWGREGGQIERTEGERERERDTVRRSESADDMCLRTHAAQSICPPIAFSYNLIGYIGSVDCEQA